MFYYEKFKKILSAVSAVVLCALPAMNSVAVNAANSSGKLNTYVIYCDVEANSGVMWADLEFRFTGNVEYDKVETGNFGGNITGGSGSRLDGTNYFSASFRALGAIVAPGNMFRATIWTTDTLKYTTELRTAAFDANRKYMGLNCFTATSVLVGDVNNDGHITDADATAVLQALGNPKDYGLSEYGQRAADVNFDGVVDKKDVDLIHDYECGAIDYFGTY